MAKIGEPIEIIEAEPAPIAVPEPVREPVPV
jgi:hypothetical protein